MIAIVLLLTALGGVEARELTAANTDACEFRQRVTVAAVGRLGRLVLPPETIDASRSDLGDIRLRSGEGEVSYALQRARRRDESIVALPAPRIQVGTDRTTIEAEVEGDAKAALVDAVILDVVESDFLKSASVWGSRDGRAFTELASAQALFRRPHGANRLLIDFAPARLNRIRVELDDRREPPVALTGLRVRTTAGDEIATETLETTIVERDDSGSESRLVLRLPYRNPFVAELAIITREPLFTRRVSLRRRTFGDGEVEEKLVAEGTIFRVAADGDNADERLRVSVGEVLAGPELTLVIDNHDSPPIAIDRVDLVVVPTALVFVRPENSILELYTGNPEGTAPRYDLAALTSELATMTVATAEAETLKRNPRYTPPALRLKLDALGAVIDVSGFRARSPVELGEASIFRLELDPMVLSESDPGGRDLRLVRDGHQIPYVADRTGYTREITVAVTSLPTSGDSNDSRYEVTLPWARLPLNSLAFAVDDELLDRAVTVVERRRDDRGQYYELPLGNARWTRRPGETRRALSIVLQQRPESVRLELRIANGDNPPLTVRGAVARYTTSKLIFAARAAGTTWLYYGNPRAAAPRYDLALMAERLLTSPYQEARLGSAERLAPEPARPSDGLNGGRKVLFWSALVFSVAVLLAVVVKLLPRAGEG